MHKMSVLERKEGDLKLRIELLAADLGLCNGGRRSEIIRELAFINKELEETEQEMGSTMGAIGPGQELCENRESFQQMEQPHKPKPAMTFPFSQDAQQAVVSQTVTETAPCDLHQHTETLSLSGNGVNGGGNKGDRFLGRGVHGGAGGTGGNVSYSDAVTNSDTRDGAADRIVRGAERALLPQTEVAEPGKRRNVVKIKWVQGREGFPGRRYVARRLIKETLGFTPDDVYALVTVTDTEFDLSFKLPQGLEEFWKGYERERGSDVWNGFEVIPVSKPEVKNVTIIFKSESINEEDVMFWLKRQCQVLSPLQRIYDEEDFWIGGWKVQVRLHSHLHVQKHLPNSLFLGKDRGVCFYVGQPRVCFKCGSNRHLAGKCTVQKCAFCGEVGHPSKDCVTIRCNLCLKLGHAYRDCPDAWHNVQKQCPNLLAELREGMGGEEGPETQGAAQRGTEGGTDLGNGGSISGEGVELTEREEQGAKKQDWRVVGGNSKKVNKRKAVPKKMVVQTENRFDLLGKSWAAIMEEEEEVSVRLGKEREEEEEVSVRLGKEREEEEEVSVRLGKEREEEEERKEKRKSVFSEEVSRGRKNKKKDQNQEDEWGSLGGDDIVEGPEEVAGAPSFQVKRTGEEKVNGKCKNQKT
uniref:CCHC-type domain-containing protein n=1 Tax=Xenopus tropicalis TaxID=8364 RepID=A0A803JAW6_XENTR